MKGIVFFGTTEFACNVLEALTQTDYVPELVVTRSDSISGRRKTLSEPPVKKWAQAYKIPVWQPANINSENSIDKLKEINPKIFVVVAYGRILNKAVLAVPALGAVNVHASLLPDLRGAAPIEWAILNGYKETGVTTMFMDEGLDTGDIILQVSTPIDPEETGGQLKTRLAAIAQKLLPETLALMLKGEAPRIAQPAGCFKYAPPIDQNTERLHWNQSAWGLANKVRALAPKPGAFCLFRGKRLKIHRASVVEGTLPLGQLSINKKRIFVGTGAGLLELYEIQPAGKKNLFAGDFINGYRLKSGETLE